MTRRLVLRPQAETELLEARHWYDQQQAGLGEQFALEEFYTVVSFALDVPTRNRQLRKWERTYNAHRPHQALGYRTPAEALADFAPSP